MGVYIKGMEMPKGCAFCRIGKRSGKKMVCPLCDEEWDSRDPMSADHRLDNCPLVHVPPHGRLIDKDALEADISASVVFSGRDGNAEIVGAKKIINRLHLAPTIIEAEEGE